MLPILRVEVTHYLHSSSPGHIFDCLHCGLWSASLFSPHSCFLSLLQQWASATKKKKKKVTTLGSGECGRKVTSSGKQRNMGGEELWNLGEEKERK